MRQRFCNGMIHVIKDGENLYQLSRMYRVPLALIMRANPYVDVYNLQPGQEICIPTVRRPMGGMMPPFGRPPMQGDGRPPVQGDGRPPVQGDGRPPVQGDGRPPVQGDGRPPVQGDGRPPMPGDGARMTEQEDDRGDISAESEDTVISHVTESARYLSDILEEENITVDEFMEYNNPEQIVVAADVTYYLPKKV